MPTSKNFELGSLAGNIDHDQSSGDTSIANNITLTGELRGPSTNNGRDLDQTNQNQYENKM